MLLIFFSPSFFYFRFASEGHSKCQGLPGGAESAGPHTWLPEKVKAYSDYKERKYFCILRRVLITLDPCKVTNSLCKDIKRCFSDLVPQGKGMNSYQKRKWCAHTHTPSESIGMAGQVFCFCYTQMITLPQHA